MSDVEIVIPVAFFLTVVAIVGLVAYFRNERLKATGGGDYRKLAEEAARGQRQMLEEVTRMNTTLKEIERLLREV